MIAILIHLSNNYVYFSDLLTVSALKLISYCDIAVVDRLVPDSIRSLVKGKIYVVRINF